jgi:hypothetical protein
VHALAWGGAAATVKGMSRCTDRSVWVAGLKHRWSDVTLWTRDHTGELRRLRHWKDVRDVELAALEAGTVWSHRVLTGEKGWSREQALAAWGQPRAMSWLDDRSARGRRPAMPVGVDAGFLERVDVIGDLHGCAMTLRELCATLGYDEQFWHPDGRRLVLLGDFADKNLVPGRNLETIRLVLMLLGTGRAVAVMGNHDRKLLRSVRAVFEAVRAAERGRSGPFRELPGLSEHAMAAVVAAGVRGDDAVRVALRAAAAWQRAATPRYGIHLTLDDLAGADDAVEVCRLIQHVYGSLSHQLVLDGGTLVAVHAATRADLIGADSRKARDLAYFGDVTGKVDADGYPVRRDWTKSWDDERHVVYGHEIQGDGVSRSGTQANAWGLDTGAYEAGEAGADGFRGLSALRWPERESVSVVTSAKDVFSEQEAAVARRRATVRTSTRREVRDTSEVDALGAVGVRLIADACEEISAAGWVCGAEARSVLAGGPVREVVVCADADIVRQALDGVLDAVEDDVMSVRGVRVRAVGGARLVDDELAATWAHDQVAVSLWGERVGDEDGPVRLLGDARMVLRERPELAVRACVEAAVTGRGLDEHLSRSVHALVRNSTDGLAPGVQAAMHDAVHELAADGAALRRFLGHAWRVGIVQAAKLQFVKVDELAGMSPEARVAALLGTEPRLA